jgi:hypothetical protein
MGSPDSASWKGWIGLRRLANGFEKANVEQIKVVKNPAAVL